MADAVQMKSSETRRRLTLLGKYVGERKGEEEERDRKEEYLGKQTWRTYQGSGWQQHEKERCWLRSEAILLSGRDAGPEGPLPAWSTCTGVKVAPRGNARQTV